MNKTDEARAQVETGAKKAAATPKRRAAREPAKKTTKAKATKTPAKKVTTTERFDVEGARLKKLVDGGLDISDAAKKAGMSVGKARRLYARRVSSPATFSPGPKPRSPRRSCVCGTTRGCPSFLTSGPVSKA
jgi:hypothetical protein